MTVTLITQILIPLLVMFTGLIGLSRSKRKGGLIIVGGMMLIGFGIVAPGLAIWAHVKRPQWCDEAYASDPRATQRPHDAFIQACLKGSYEAIHCMIPSYVNENHHTCAKYSAEVAKILSAQ